MRARSGVLPILLIVAGAITARAQATEQARFAIQGTLISTEGAARIPMPLGKSGVELSDRGVISRDKLQKELAKHGQAILPGKVVSITAIEFNDKSIEFEIDGGGTKKRSILSNVQVSVGGGSSDDLRDQGPAARGSRITLSFAGKVPLNITADEIRNLLNPVLDFNKQSLAKTGIEALPPEYQEAVKLKEARIGMDSNTVLLSMGRPDRRRTEKNSEGVEQEDWIYNGRGRRQTLVTFENDVVVSVRQY